MRSKPTSIDVAKAAGVSQATVSRTFRDDPRVSPATRDRVREVARALGYYPDAFARRMVTRRSGIIAVIVPDVDNPVFATMVATLHGMLQQRGLRMMLFLDRADEPAPHHELGAAGLPVDGVILTSATVTSPVVSEVFEREIPSILLQRDAPAAAIDRVMPDDEHGCHLVAKHLLDLGHTRIGLISGSPTTSSGIGRRAHFSAALEALGGRVDESLMRVSTPHFGAAREAARELMTMPNGPTAIFCASDTIAITVFDVAVGLGVRIPDDLSIVGFDDIDLASWSMIGLTTVRQDLVSQCEIGLTRLLARIEGVEDGPLRVLSPVELMIRSTTAPPAT